jgi:hypothetical protein
MPVRIALSLRRAALITAGVAVTLSTSLLPAQAAARPTGWRPANEIVRAGQPTVVTSVSASSGGNAWAAASTGAAGSATPVTEIMRWNGRAWRLVPLPPAVAHTWTSRKNSAAIIGTSSASNVWAFGVRTGTGGEAYLRLHGGRWSTGLLPGTGQAAGRFLTVTTVRVLSAGNVWVFGAAATATVELQPFAEHFDGHRWKFTALPGSGEVTGASAVSAGNIWAVTGVVGDILGLGAPWASSVLHWNGKSWRRMPRQPGHLPKSPDFTSIIAGPHGRLTIGGFAGFRASTTVEVFTQGFSGSAWARPAILRGWSARPLGPDAVPVIESLVADGHGGLWALGDTLGLAAPRLWHLTRGKVFGPQQPGFGSSRRALLQLASVPGTASVWAAGTVSHGSQQDGLIGVYGRTPR